jgi:predicted nucleic acid-binding protein
VALVVVDASALVALLAGDDPDSRWAFETCFGADLAAPHLAPFEVASVLRRLERSRRMSGDQVAQAFADLLDLPVQLWSFEALAGRAWELRPNLTAYDATYVALAELTEAPLVTLDRHIASAPGIRCAVVHP